MDQSTIDRRRRNSGKSAGPKAMLPLLGSLTLLLNACGGSGDSGATSAATTTASFATQCSAMTGKSFGPATVQGASFVAATATVPDYCMVSATETGQPQFQMTALLPSNWSGAVVQSGGGGFDGTVPTPTSLWDSIQPLSSGIAFIGSNGGHQQVDPANPASILANNPQALTDYWYRAIGTTFDFGKSAITQFYGKPLQHSYFEGCSKGGTEAMMAATHYPDDYDGIIAQSTVIHVNGWISRVADYASLTPLTGTKWESVYNAYVAQCDALDGVVDGIVSNPGACKMDPAALTFLTTDEIKTVRAVTSDLALTGGTVVYPKMSWGMQGGQPNSFFDAIAFLGTQWMKYPILNNPNYSPTGFNLDTAYSQIVAANAPYSVDVDATAVANFLKKGKKLLVFQGDDDAAVSVEDNTNFQQSLVQAAGAAASNTQMYMLPGVGHCGGLYGGAVGANSINALSALRAWVEQGQQPAGLTATRFASDGKTVQITRPLCTLGTYPKFNGSGDASKAENFSCVPNGT